MKGQPIFGHSLSETMELQRKWETISFETQKSFWTRIPPLDIPFIVHQILLRLSHPRPLSEEGLFRISGNSENVLHLRSEIDAGNFVPFATAPVHDLTALLKMYLRDLPDPLIPENVCHKASELLSSSSEPPVIQLWVLLLAELSKDARILLHRVCSFLSVVASHSSENRMPVDNLLIVFLPTLKIPAPLLTLLINKPDVLLEDPQNISVPGSMGHEHGPDPKSPRRRVPTSDKKSLTGGKITSSSECDLPQLQSPRGRKLRRDFSRDEVFAVLNRTASSKLLSDSPDGKPDKE